MKDIVGQSYLGLLDVIWDVLQEQSVRLHFTTELVGGRLDGNLSMVPKLFQTLDGSVHALIADVHHKSKTRADSVVGCNGSARHDRTKPTKQQETTEGSTVSLNFNHHTSFPSQRMKSTTILTGHRSDIV